VEKNPLTVHANASTSANVDQVAVVEQRYGDQSLNHVHPCLPDEEIGNWESVDVPMVFSSDKM